jgi:hypothetical protein
MALDSLPAEHLGTLTATLRPSHNVIENGPTAARRGTATVISGDFEGPRIRAAIPEGVAGADWWVMRADGVAALDVRLNLVTDDGAEILVTYLGLNVDGVLKVSPCFETGDERYAWLNKVFAVGIGVPDGDGVRYEVYAL